MTINFYGKAKKLDDIDIPKIGALIGVGEDEMHAFIDVETGGRGFDSQGRPRMLFEPHKFYSALPSGAKRDQAVREGLAYRKWGEERYPRDSYPRLIKAMRIDEEAALRSASWGMGQIMGFNSESLDFKDVFEMVTLFTEDEEHHLRASIEFIKVNNLAAALRAKNWAAFALGYNGPRYRDNRYDVRLAYAYNKWRRIPDTPFTPSGSDFFKPAYFNKLLRRGDRGSNVAQLIKMLSQLGFYKGVLDDVFGGGTQRAVKAFQAARGLTVDGIVGQRTWTALNKNFKLEMN